MEITRNNRIKQNLKVKFVKVNQMTKKKFILF